MSDLMSRPYRPDPKMACERCTFNSGSHHPDCEVAKRKAKILALFDQDLLPMPGSYTADSDSAIASLK